MKYQVVELSIRKYLGLYADKTSWEHMGYAIGIIKDNEVYDYKTLEKYNPIYRNDKGILNVDCNYLVKGQIYAIGDTAITFDSNKRYSTKEIDKGINESMIYSYEYKKRKRKIK